MIRANKDLVKLTESGRGRIESLADLFPYYDQRRYDELLPIVAREHEGNFYVINGRNRLILSNIFRHREVELYVPENKYDCMCHSDFPKNSRLDISENRLLIARRYNSCVDDHHELAERYDLKPGFSHTDIAMAQKSSHLLNKFALKSALLALGYNDIKYVLD